MFLRNENGPAPAPSENKTYPPTNWRNSYHYATRRNIGQFYFDGSQQYAYFSAGMIFYFLSKFVLQQYVYLYIVLVTYIIHAYSVTLKQHLIKHCLW